ncbi:MAG: alanine racemase [Planctomycetes bacterium]|nr:alanine racemase [Planctomycetota bacterium]
MGNDGTARWAALRALRCEGGGPLRVGGVTAAELAERFGTPLYAHDAQALRDRIDDVRGALGGDVGLLLALKANPLVALARVAAAHGAGAEVASAGEILVARAAGLAGPRIQFAGPGKSDDDLRAALEHGVVVNLESEREHARLAALARTTGRRPEVAIRVNPGTAQTGSRLRMADARSRFGVDQDRVAALAEAIERDGACRLRGLHVYGGSQTFDAASWVATAAGLTALAADVAAVIGHPLDSLNFGGGFGWPVYDGDPELDLAAAGAGLRDVLAAAPHRPRALHVELGRYLLAGGGVFLTRVVDVKRSGDERQVVVDGGMHQFGAAAGMGAVMRRAYAIVAADDPLGTRAPADPAALGGPLCTPADRFAKSLELPELAPGDLLAILNAGAYGLTFSPHRFLGHPGPAEVVVDGGAARLARRRGSPADGLADQEP